MADLVPRSFFDFPSRMGSLLSDDFFNFPSVPSGLSISEDDRHVYVEAAVPGLDPDDVEVTHENGVLKISGQGREEEKGRRYFRKSSRSYGYHVEVPGNVDTGKEPDVSYRNGMLTVTFRKAAESNPKRLKVKKA